jgi:hypothetical protein
VQTISVVVSSCRVKSDFLTETLGNEALCLVLVDVGHILDFLAVNVISPASSTCNFRMPSLYWSMLKDSPLKKAIH